MLSLVREASVVQNIPTAIFSLEMTELQCVMKLLCSFLSINIHDIKEGNVKLNGEVVPEALRVAPIFINDTPGLSIQQFKSIATGMVKENAFRIIFVDYLQLMTVESERDKTFNTRKEEVDYILHSLKTIANELGSTIVALSQMSKYVGDMNRIKPILSDIDYLDTTIPDTICFIHRPRYYTSHRKLQENENALETIELICARNKDGETGTIELTFNSKYYRIENKLI